MIAMILSAACLTGPATSEGPSPGLLAAPLSQADALERLPIENKDSVGPLPVWARMLAGKLPTAAAGMLQVDYAHRTQSPLDPVLRAAMRYVAAKANGCAYAQTYALADAKSAGLDSTRQKSLEAGDFAGWSKADRDALAFARGMTLSSSSVTDDQFAELVREFGEKKTAAMVILLAFANFQDRLLICLGAQVEEGGPLPPLNVSMLADARSRPNPPPPQRKKQELPKPVGHDAVADDGDWGQITYEQLQNRLEHQRRRSTRLPVPTWEQVEKGLPPGTMKPTKIVWYLITMGYVPELGIPFERFMRTTGAEVSPKYDRLFAGAVFWVVTKAIDCPYCMGHCEMNWEVAGLSQSEIAERSKLLASEDWSSFAPEQQRAFAFARKLTQRPSDIGDADIKTLKADLGDDLALIVALSASRYNYMTRISNGFQLTLESENVFFDYYGVTPPSRSESASAGHSERSVRVLSNEEAWQRLPKASRGADSPLPAWARAVAVQLPRTAAAMLELDYAQRTKSPLDPKLRAKMRWVIARANRCEYTQADALADLKRAGADETEVSRLTAGPDSWTADEREPLEFARLLTVAAPTIPDSMFESLRKRFGDKQTAAMVLLGAYGNFQDRIVLGLGLATEPNGPLPPADIAFEPGAIQLTPLPLPTRPVPALATGGQSVVERDPEWSELTYDALQSRLEQQRARNPRLPIPRWEDVKRKLPPALAARPVKIVWTLTCLGYVPELAIPWNNATRTVWAEAESDKVLEESLFWVQTRAIRCNYCMGHCEMLLEVAGLSKDQIAERTRALAGDDWSAFPPEEQRAYAYARKLSKTPWELTTADYSSLQNDFGPKRGMALFWWLCRGLYMTRVSDGFQLPLERENVFANFYPKQGDDSSGAPKR